MENFEEFWKLVGGEPSFEQMLEELNPTDDWELKQDKNVTMSGFIYFTQEDKYNGLLKSEAKPDG